MNGLSKKRSSDGASPEPAKRQRTGIFWSGHMLANSEEERTERHQYDVEELGRDGLQRVIAMSLKQVGFTSARPEALESFITTTETYITGLLEHIKQTANGSRRPYPTAEDFEASLDKHSLPPSSLKRQLRRPLLKESFQLAAPATVSQGISSDDLPCFSDELDGRYDKEARPWIPKSLPAFPSRHSYRWTAAEVSAVRDPQKKRAEAAADARKGEMALRRIDRAAKITRHKELKEIAQRDPLSHQRHIDWENLMENLLAKKNPARGGKEIADHSTIVNAGVKYGRKEVPRGSRRVPAEAKNGHA